MENIQQYIKWLNVPQAQKNLRNIGYDLILTRKLPETVLGGRAVKLQHHLLLICRRGSISGTVNFSKVDIKPADIMLAVVGQLVQLREMSDDFEGFFVLVTPNFLRAKEIDMTSILPLRVLSNLRTNPGCPVMQLQESKLTTLIGYFNLLYRIMTDEANPHRSAATATLLKSFMIEAGYFIAENPSEFEHAQIHPVVSRFVTLVAQDHCQHRDLSYFAHRLSLSESQVYRIMKQYLGKSAREWIEEYIIAEAKGLLATTDLTIQQIAGQLNFPSQSFFGKYFKRIAGMSPLEYRKGH